MDRNETNNDETKKRKIQCCTRDNNSDNSADGSVLVPTSPRPPQQLPKCILNLKTLQFGKQSLQFFLLSPNITFINHGSFGATAKIVLAKQRKLVNTLESHPDQWFRRNVQTEIRNSAKILANFIGANENDLVFVQNATTGINSVLRSLELHDSDGVLVLSLHYSPILTTLRRTCEYKQEIIDLTELNVSNKLPLPTSDELIELVESNLKANPQIKIAIFDHITSPTALVLPVKTLVQICHKYDVRVLIDGAHACGQIPLNLNDINCDYYVGTCHKWLFSCKGSAFLWAKQEVQSILSPLVTVQWDADFINNFLRQGTRDETAFICAGVAVKLYQHIGFERIRKRNSELVIKMALALAKMWNTEILAPKSSGYQGSFMACVRLPITDLNCTGLNDDRSCKECEMLRDLLLSRYSIEASMVYHFVNKLWIRISCHVYNEEEDYMKLGRAILDIVNNGILDTAKKTIGANDAQ